MHKAINRKICGKTPMQSFNESKDIAIDKSNQLAIKMLPTVIT
jgi:hypothetical protein